MIEKVPNLRLETGQSENALPKKAARKLGIKPADIKSWRILKKSLDARKKNDIHYVYTVAVSCDEDIPAVSEPVIKPKRTGDFERPVVAGFGPAGMMASLKLAREGLCPIVIERGKKVDERTADVEKFKETGILNPESNVQFGEGGAGTFSDGKLNTGTHDSRIREVLEEFYRHGAPESVLFDAKPHIGTDVLVNTVKSIREEILSLGGEIYFETKLEELIVSGGRITGIKVRNGNQEKTIKCSSLILAIGHSARDTFEELHRENVPMEKKAFSMGARIEHSQEDISRAQYGDKWRELPPADYSLAVHLNGKESAYTFCMCPGGYVFAAASEEGGVCTNGMSYSGRSGENANSALLVTLRPEDIPGDGPLSGMYYQREIERRAYEYALDCGRYFATAQRVGDFLGTHADAGFSTGEKILPTYRPGVKWGDIRKVLPENITDVMAKAIVEFDKKLKGFADPEAILTAPETRSSSPVRILRGENLQSEIAGLYPCGEGAGYAGGITSAAVDGLRCAEKIIACTAQGDVL